MESTVIRTPRLSGVTVTWLLRSIGLGIVRFTTWAQKRPKSVQPTQSWDQRFLASEVQTTTRPRPYCHSANSGSTCEVASSTWLEGLGVVDTYPCRAGMSAVLKPSSN